jgi:hypothetical protein
MAGLLIIERILYNFHQTSYFYAAVSGGTRTLNLRLRFAS